ncbi:MAG TPA: hypothetical protein VE178_07380 [Silvibacterium sp.]|nr:hypothetical protein [Silvibacterium sp.]
MSGILERMAKRARGALPTVEPRSLPLFAPSATEFADKQIPAASIQVVFDEVVPSRSFDGSPRKGQRSLLEEDEQRTVRDENFDPPSIRQSVRRTTTTHAGRGENNQQPEASKPGPRRQNSQQATNAQFESEEKIASTKQQPSVENYAGGIEVALEAEKRSVKPIVYQPQEETPFAAALIERRVKNEAAKEVASSDESAAPARAGAKAARQRRQQDQSIAARNEWPAATSDSAREQRTEIHISIGSIELRAPRVEARPQSVPFRPRVTLSDFLSRKPESRA